MVLYSRTPLLRPPSKSDWSGRKSGVVVHEGLDYFITCGLRHTRIYIQCTNSFVHTEKVFRSANCRSRENAEKRRPGLAAFSNNNAVFFLDQSTQHFDIGPYKTTFRKHRSNNFGSHIYVDCLRPYTATLILCPLYPSRPIESASCRPQVNDLPFSTPSIIRLFTI